MKSFTLRKKEVIIHTEGEICGNIQELTNSPIFERIVHAFMDHLKKHNSLLSDSLFPPEAELSYRSKILSLLRILTTSSLEEVVKILPDYSYFLDKKNLLHEFVEKLYNFWRRYERYMICHSESGIYSHDQKPYRTFNMTVERLSHLVRAGYRDICENITGTHPRVYRQVDAGCQAGIIAVPKIWNPPSEEYRELLSIPFIRQLMIQPPLLLDPPMNKRTGHFQKVTQNLLSNIMIDEKKWLCYPAQFVLENLPLLSNMLHISGYLVLSGFQGEDVPLIQQKALLVSLEIIQSIDKNNWVTIVYQKRAKNQLSD
jgi:hypothetical protein